MAICGLDHARIVVCRPAVYEEGEKERKMTDLGQDYGDFVNLDDECEVEDDSEPRNHYCRRYSTPST